MCCNEGALYEARNKTSASCAVSRSNLEIALFKSIHRLRKQLSMVAPRVRGAPSNVDDDGVYWMNCRNEISLMRPLTDIASHFLSFRYKP